MADEGVASRLLIAQEALTEANQRREVAVEAVVDYALRAIVDGEPLDAIMDACGFKDDGGGAVALNPLVAALGLGGFQGCRQERFAQWIGSALATKIANAEHHHRD